MGLCKLKKECAGEGNWGRKKGRIDRKGVLKGPIVCKT